MSGSPNDSRPVATGVTFRSATTIEDEIARLDQALVDLEACRAASVSLVHAPSRTRERALVRALGERARHRRFVTAEVSLLEHSPHTPDALVRHAIDALVPPGDHRPRGLPWLLDLYWERHGKNSALRFEEGTKAEAAEGDLTALCHAYLATDDEEATSEVRAFTAWLDGTEPARKHQNPLVRRALSEQTAQRAIGELSRVVRALGYRGLVLFLSAGDAIVTGTERQRERSYTVLRELVDNFDAGNGAVATRVMLTGTDALFEGDLSIRSLAPLLMRLEVPSDAEPPPPHRAWTSLVREPYAWVHRRITPPPARRAAALRNLIRISQGLPPTEAVSSMSVAHDRIERTIDRLFRHMDVAGSVLSVLVGEYGSGKTHLMMHLADRALTDGRPVFWLNLERMNLDLGNPARHFSRIIEQSALPTRGRPSARQRAATWTRRKSKLQALEVALEEIAAGDGEEAIAAQKALRIRALSRAPGRALEGFLCGFDLEQRDTSPAYRRDAYRRVLLWIALLGRLEGCNGAVVLIDEAENLYTSGVPWATRRTALRSLAFYCGGALPGSCVVMAMTPPAFEQLGHEARALLREADDMASTLDLEDVDLFRRRLAKLEPEQVPLLARRQRFELAKRVQKVHRSVRGPVELADEDALVNALVRRHRSPRTLVRALVDELESAHWAGR